MNRRVAAIGLAAGLAAAIALIWSADPFGRSPSRIAPSDEDAAQGDGRGSRAPIELAPPAASTESSARAEPPAPPGVDATPPQPDDGPTFHGRVVDGATGAPIPNAIVEAAASPLATGAEESGSDVSQPRRPLDRARAFAATSGPVMQTRTDSAGRFRLRWSPEGPADLRIGSPAYLDEMRASVRPGDEVTVSLRPGTPIRGRVHRSDGVPIEGALIRASTIPKDGAVRGVLLSATSKSDGSGAFAVMGLSGVSSSLRVTHPDYMPAEYRWSTEGAPVDISLAPAFRVWFRLRSNDGTSIPAPSVQWTRTSSVGTPLSVGAADLSFGSDEGGVDATDRAPPAPDGFGPLKIPATPSDGTVRFVVRVIGRLPWTSDEIAISAGGGERTIDAALERDPAVGALRVRLREPGGADLPYRSGETPVWVRRTDGASQIGRPVERDGALVFDGLAAGTFLVVATERRFGAATATVTIEGGRESAVDMTLAAAAVLRVRAEVGTARRIHFQLLRDRLPVEAFEDPPTPGRSNRSQTTFFAGADGVVLHGLSAGKYSVRVLSPDLVAEDVDVELATGATAEATIHPKPR